MFDKLTTAGLEKVEDRLGGFSPLETDIYPMTIQNAFAGQSPGGALNLTLILKSDSGREYRETIYVSNKQKENFYLNPQDKSKKVPLPGFTTVNNLCIATTGKPLSEQEFEEKQVKIWNSDTRKEEPQAAQVAVDLIGKQAHFAIQKVRENKNEQLAGSTEWTPTAEERVSNSIDTVFEFDSKMTVAEAINGAENAEFYDKWLAANKGKERDNRKIKGGEAGKTGAPPKAGGAAPAAGSKTTASIFKKS